MHAVVFDIDGTLLHSSATDDALYRRAVRSVLGTIRLRAELDDYPHVSDSGILAQVFADNDIEPDAHTETAIRDAFFALMQRHIAARGPFEEVWGANKLLKRLIKSERHAVAIATGGWRRTAALKLASAGFDIDGIPLATSDDAHQRTDIMRIALGHLGRDFEAVTYFGDGRWDAAACRALGWTFRAVGPALGGIDCFDREFPAP